MMRYHIYHARNDYFFEFLADVREHPPEPRPLNQTHVYLHTFEADDLSDLWNKLQAEYWRPDARQDALIVAEQTHTTFSAGDVAQDEHGVYWQCMRQGWRRLT